MFDIGFLELLVIFVLGLVVIGPERLPSTIKTCAIWFSRFKRSIQEARAEFEQQIGADEIRREIHNERVMESMRKFEEQRAELENKVNEFKDEMEAAATNEGTANQTNTNAPVHSGHAHAGNCTHCAHDEHSEAAETKQENSSEAHPKASNKEPEPHPAMVHDDSGADASDLPGRTPSIKQSETEKENGKQ